MRSTYATLSASSEPPKPRLITGTPGKSFSNDVHFTIDELPMNTTPFFGGGRTASCCVNLSIAPAHFSGAAKSSGARHRAERVSKRRSMTKNSGDNPPPVQSTSAWSHFRGLANLARLRTVRAMRNLLPIMVPLAACVPAHGATPGADYPAAPRGDHV